MSASNGASAVRYRAEPTRGRVGVCASGNGGGCDERAWRAPLAEGRPR